MLIKPKSAFTSQKEWVKGKGKTVLGKAGYKFSVYSYS